MAGGRARSFFLKKTPEFDRVRKKGSVIRNPFFTLVYLYQGSIAPSRVGIVAGKRVGKAVTRNRLKRVCRELVRESFPEMVPGYECILFPKQKLLYSSFQEASREWKNILREIGLLSPGEPG